MKKKILIGILIVLLIAGSVAFWYLSQPPKETLTKEFKEEAVSELLGRKAQLDAPEEKTGNTLFDGKYLSFEYPARALEYTYRDPNSTGSSSAILEDFIFQIKVPRLRFAYTITNSSGVNSINDIPSVKLRESRSYEYEKENLNIGKSQGLSFYKKGQDSEKSGFIMNEGMVYTFIATGNSEEDVELMYNDIVRSAKFK